LIVFKIFEEYREKELIIPSPLFFILQNKKIIGEKGAK
jgi:hypothetical protein